MSDELKKGMTFKVDDETAPEPDHHISFSFSDVFDKPHMLRATIIVEWCKYKEQVDALQKRIDELEAQLAQVAKENDWMKYPEPPESGAK